MEADPAGANDVRATVEAVWRIESAKLIGALTRLLRDVSLAEEFAQDALVAALEQWPREGLPTNPAAWLMATARRRAIDRLRHLHQATHKHEEMGREMDEAEALAALTREEAMDDTVGDDVLRLMFIACHPVLSVEAQLALTLRLLGGLTTDEIARAFLLPEPTIAQRIVRAKRTLSEARAPFELPQGDALADRLGAVLKVLYLIFNEGYTATAGADWLRPALCEEALRLGRVLAELAPTEAEVHGLVALMEIQASRSVARVAADGSPVLLADQNRARWDQLLIRRGLAALARAEQLGGAHGPYALQAAIAACHARARASADTDWARITALYDALHALNPSPVIALNRAVAVSMAYGPAAALPLVEALAEAPQLAGYHLLPSVRGDLLERLGRLPEATDAFLEAAAHTRNEREQAFLLARAERCKPHTRH